MDVANIGRDTNPVNSSRVNQLSQEDFMKLLLTQLKLQSPQNPFDSNTMMQQMSQLTTLSATQSLEKTVKNLNTSLSNSQVIEASQLIGKKVQILNEQAPLKANQGLQGAVFIPDQVDSLTVTIKDQNDRVVKTLNFGASNGIVDFNWDGLDNNNQMLAPGMYKISASGNKDGQNIAVATAAVFDVNSVSLDSQGKGAILQLAEYGGVQMQDILKIF